MGALPVPVFGERALHLPDDGTLVVGDLHVGLEAELRESGIHLPSQSWRMRERLQSLISATRANRLVVIGDLKHAIPTASRDERMDLPDFFEGLGVELDLVRGNHDVDLGVLPSDVRVHDAGGIRLGDVGLTHGHTWPDDAVMAAPVVVTCHNHPMVMLKDELGHRHKEPCWVRAAFTDVARERYPGMPPASRLLVMPAFNDLLGGVAFNGTDRPLGPLFGNGLADVEQARLTTLDGVDLGTVADLRAWGDAAGAKRRRADGSEDPSSAKDDDGRPRRRRLRRRRA